MQFTFLCFNRSDRWVDVPWTSRDITKVFIDSNELVIGEKTAKSDVYEHNVQIEIAKKKKHSDIYFASENFEEMS